MIVCGLVLVSVLFTFVGCQSAGKLKQEYFYNSKGEYVAYINNNFLYDKETRKAIAKYDDKNKVFYNNTGYFGEVYKDYYLLKNENSKYLNYSFPNMGIAPTSPLKPFQPQKIAIVMPSGFRDCFDSGIVITRANYNEHLSLEATIDGYAGYYVYINSDCILKSFTSYQVKNAININFNYTVSYKGYLKTNTSQSKLFNASINISLTMSAGGVSGVKRASIYNLGHTDYGFYETISSSILVTSISGSIIKK